MVEVEINFASDLGTGQVGGKQPRARLTGFPGVGQIPDDASASASYLLELSDQALATCSCYPGRTNRNYEIHAEHENEQQVGTNSFVRCPIFPISLTDHRFLTLYQ